MAPPTPLDNIAVAPDCQTRHRERADDPEHNWNDRKVACGLNELDQLGLVRAEKVRLTFVGLMKATGLRAQSTATQAA